MNIRKCTPREANEAAIKYGSRDEHEFKRHVLNTYLPISRSDIFIDTNSGYIYIGDKDGQNLQETGVRL